MDLTEQEVQAARGLLRNVEGQAKGWKFARWVCLAAGLALVAVASYGPYAAFQAEVTHLSAPSTTKPSTRPAMQADLELVQTDMRVEMVQLLGVMLTATMGVLQVLLGSITVVSVLVSWRRNSHARILAKLLRNYLEERQLLPPEATHNKDSSS